MAKSNNNEIKARSKWTLGDIVVHIILVTFGYLGTADRMDNHDKLQRREGTVCFNSAAKVSDSGELYKAFYRHRYPELHADVQEYFDNSNFHV